MSRHFRNAQGRLLQADKSWRNLKPKQQEYLALQLKERYLAAYEKSGKKPSKQECQRIVDSIDYRGIWIPRREVVKYLDSRKTRWMNQYRKRHPEEPQAGGGEHQLAD